MDFPINSIWRTHCRIKRVGLMIVLTTLFAGCHQKPEPAPEPKGIQRSVIQGFQTTFYRMRDGKQRWIEIMIAVDGNNTFRMPVFFTNNGQIIQVGDDEASALIDKWLKHRAENVAAFGSIDPQAGLNGTFLAIDQHQP